LYFFDYAGCSVQKGHLAQKRIGRTAGELLEIFDEMRPVEVSTVGRQVGPLNRTTHRSIFGCLPSTYGLPAGPLARVPCAHDAATAPRPSESR
jgi:hypothetical protein